MNICIIEDDPATRMLLKTLVNAGSTAKHAVLDCLSGEDALSRLQAPGAMHPDVFLVDHDLPGISGIEVIKRIRSTHGSGSEYFPYIMMVTAHEAAEALNSALDAGANDYLTKPVNAKVLQTRLRVAQKLIGQAAIAAQEDYLKSLAAYALAQAAAPMAIVECTGPQAPWKIHFANAALATLIPAAASGSLDDATAWTPEFRANAWHALAQAAPLEAMLASTSPDIAALALVATLLPISPAPASLALLLLQPKAA
jgi:CheY-like chemotaxis protein